MRFGSQVWPPGLDIALALVPGTDFVYEHNSKTISHCFFLLSAPTLSMKFIDPIDKVCLIELRGIKVDGGLGHDTNAIRMVGGRLTEIVDQTEEALLDKGIYQRGGMLKG